MLSVVNLSWKRPGFYRPFFCHFNISIASSSAYLQIQDFLFGYHITKVFPMFMLFNWNLAEAYWGGGERADSLSSPFYEFP